MSIPSKFTPDEDAPLLQSWYRGDISAFETLVWKYLKRVFSLAYYLTGSHESAAAAAEAAFVAAFVNISSFNSRFHFANWLISLTLKETREQLDYRDNTQPKEVQISGLQDLLREEILQLPPELAEVLVLCNVRGYSLERLSEIFQLRTDFLLTRLFDAHEMLGTLIRQRGAPPGIPVISSEEKSFPHPEIRLSFHAYLDSSLSPADADNIRKHLKSCGSCREALTGLELIIEHLKELPDMDPPHSLTANIMEKVKTPPEKKVNPTKPAPILAVMLGAGLLLVAIIALSAYQLLHNHENLSPAVPGAESRQKSQPASPAAALKSTGVDLLNTITAPFRSQGKTTAKEEPPKETPVTPPPPAAPAAEKPALSPAPPVNAPAAAPLKSEPAGKREKVEKTPELPSEWGESPPLHPRVQQKKSAPVRSRSSEVAVELVTEDPLAAVQKVENAVTASGGEITGRAYSSGSDILYTRVDIDKFFDLMTRLGKVGRIQELPQPPEGAEGTIDLIIKWQ